VHESLVVFERHFEVEYFAFYAVIDVGWVTEKERVRRVIALIEEYL
jgi:hypothetical protein